MNVNTPWDFAKSIFKPYRADNPKLLEECFEIDWHTIEYKLTKLMEKKYGLEQIEAVKNYLSTQYKHIREAYKYYAGSLPLGRVMSISMFTFN